MTSTAPSCESRRCIVRGPMIGAVTAGVLAHEGERQVDQGHHGLIGQPGVGSVELALVVRVDAGVQRAGG